MGLRFCGKSEGLSGLGIAVKMVVRSGVSTWPATNYYKQCRMSDL